MAEDFVGKHRRGGTESSGVPALHGSGETKEPTTTIGWRRLVQAFFCLLIKFSVKKSSKTETFQPGWIPPWNPARNEKFRYHVRFIDQANQCQVNASSIPFS